MTYSDLVDGLLAELLLLLGAVVLLRQARLDAQRVPLLLPLGRGEALHRVLVAHGLQCGSV